MNLKKWYKKTILVTILCALLGTLGLEAGAISAMILGNFIDEPREEKVEITYIYSLEDDHKPFVLGYGSDNCHGKFYYVRVFKDGTPVICRLSDREWIVHKTDERKPALRRHYSTPKNWIDLWAIHDNKEGNWYIDVPPETREVDFSIVTVP